MWIVNTIRKIYERCVASNSYQLKAVRALPSVPSPPAPDTLQIDEQKNNHIKPHSRPRNQELVWNRYYLLEFPRGVEHLITPAMSITTSVARQAIMDLELHSPAPDAASERGVSPATTTSSGTKRKRETGPKFYSVRTGFQPGIYHSWADCLSQVKGYKNAMCTLHL